MSSAAALTVTRLACDAMGTRFEFALVGDDAAHVRAAGEEAIAEVQELHARYSLFSPASLVTRINRRAAIEPVGVDRETFGLLSIARNVWAVTGGAFDITVGPLMRAWGFRDGTPDPAGSAANPVGMDLVELDEASCMVHFARPGVELDLGAIAKGFALDRVAETLRGAGVECALLHGGTSTVLALGSPPDHAGWRVRIADDDRPLDVAVRDEALSVSAPRGRIIDRAGATVGHIIDPRPDRRNPAVGAISAAAVHESAVLADAWSTALLVLRARPDSTPATMTTMIRIEDENSPWCIDGSRAMDLCAAPPTSLSSRPFETELDA